MATSPKPTPWRVINDSGGGSEPVTFLVQSANRKIYSATSDDGIVFGIANLSGDKPTKYQREAVVNAIISHMFFRIYRKGAR
jgi:hypothetical protein